MLPLPVSLASGQHRRAGKRHYRSTRDVLLARARVTNLGVVLLAAFAAVSFLCNLSAYFARPAVPDGRPHARSIDATIARPPAVGDIDHLIVVPGHAIWTGDAPEESLDERSWVLEPYQKGGGRVQTFFKHIAAAAELAQHDEHSLLVFSGGQTRPASTTTEAESYMRLAHLSRLLPPAPHRVAAEHYALDSFQNLLFALARFREVVGRYPARVTVVGYGFKHDRFADLHRAALRWPAGRFHYVGIDAENARDVEVARDGERRNGYGPYTTDLYGCHGELLAKRRARNVALRFHPYLTSAPELRELFEWCPGEAEGGQTALFKGPLPWDDLR